MASPEGTQALPKVGWIGLGIMGSRMAANLRGAGFEVCVWNRTRATAEDWAAEHGAEVFATPRELAGSVDVLFSMVVDGEQVSSVLLDSEDAAVHGAREGLLCVDMSTIAPADTRRIGAALAEHGVRFMDAPVTGSSPKAEAGTLTIIVGGEASDLEVVSPAFDAMGALTVHVGELGQGEMLKVINNAMAAINTAVVAEALLVAKRTGVSLDAFEQVVAAGSGGSAMLELKSGPMRAHDYSTLFKLEHMLKDVRLCIEAAQAAGVPFPSAGYVRELLTASAGRGHGDADFAAVIEAIEGLAGVRL
jgi:3-hydroxyisobutyrate dehydrogenase-like beta-hydroxyacid dehydrogenase